MTSVTLQQFKWLLEKIVKSQNVAKNTSIYINIIQMFGGQKNRLVCQEKWCKGCWGLKLGGHQQREQYIGPDWGRGRRGSSRALCRGQEIQVVWRPLLPVHCLGCHLHCPVLNCNCWRSSVSVQAACSISGVLTAEYSEQAVKWQESSANYTGTASLLQ